VMTRVGVKNRISVETVWGEIGTASPPEAAQNNRASVAQAT